MLPKGVKVDSACIAFFDGGSASRVGTAGYVCYKPDGSLWFGAGIMLPAHQCTNNSAELAACTALVEELHKQGGLPDRAESVVLHGDSQLIISFLNRKAKSSTYFLEVQRLRGLLK